MQRRTYRRAFTRGIRPKRHYQWAREDILFTGAFTSTTIDLLAKWKQTNNLTLNLPDIVIWRIHIKISIHYTLSPATVLADDSMGVAMFVDSLSAGLAVVAFTNPYDESYLMWDKIYCSDTMANGSNVQAENTTLFKEYDIRSHRKLQNQNDTLLLQLVPHGNLTMGAADAYDITSSVLLKLPGRG